MDVGERLARERIDSLIALSRQRTEAAKRAAAVTAVICHRSQADRLVLEALATAGEERANRPADWGHLYGPASP